MLKKPLDLSMPLTSTDVISETLAALRDLLPAAFTAGKLDVNRLQQLLGDDVASGPERYGLSWAGKSDAIHAVQSLSSGTLLPAPEESVHFDTSENLILEGDNLEILKLLQKSYHGKVKMIYIDPPYNTGNEFIYPDNFREGLADYLRYSGQVSGRGMKTTVNAESGGRYHSNWLTMMYPRLFLARNLLTEGGVIFVSIDDHEVHNLRLMMNELFGEEGFVASFVWRRRVGSSLASSWVSSDHEYILAYARNAEAVYVRGDERDMNKYSIPDGKGSYYASMPLTVGMTRAMRPNQWYELKNPKTGTGYWPPEGRVWGFIPKSMDARIAQDKIMWPEDYPDSKRTTPRYKAYPEDAKRERKPTSTWIAEKQEKPAIDADTYTLTASKNEEGTRVLKELLGDSGFAYPKPLSLMKVILEQFTKGDDLILDFFAGSGTTAQAVIELNKEDGGSRNFIMVQLPEPTNNPQLPTISDITKERVRRVITKLDGIDKNTVGADRGFKVFKLASSNFKTWDADATPKDAAGLAQQLKLYVSNVEPGRSPDDILYELLLKAGLPLSAVVEKITKPQEFYTVAEGVLLVCLADPILTETLAAMRERKPQRVICLDTAFHGNDQLKTNTVLDMKSAGIEFRTV